MPSLHIMYKSKIKKFNNSSRYETEKNEKEIWEGKTLALFGPGLPSPWSLSLAPVLRLENTYFVGFRRAFSYNGHVLQRCGRYARTCLPSLAACLSSLCVCCIVLIASNCVFGSSALS